MRFVDVEGEECAESVTVPPLGETSDPILSQPADEPVKITPEHHTATFDEELPVSYDIYRSAKEVVEAAMQDVRMGRAIDSDSVSRLVTGMVDSIRARGLRRAPSRRGPRDARRRAASDQ